MPAIRAPKWSLAKCCWSKTMANSSRERRCCRNVKVEATVLEHDRAKKIIVFKKKRKKQYRRTNGHRQDFTAVRIESITL